MQCLQNDDVMGAAPYFLAVSDDNVLIDELCKRNLFKEAFVVAKMRKLNDKPFGENEDKTLSSIVDRWGDYLNSNGHFEAAATV